MTHRPDVIISIINYRTVALTIACLVSVLADLDGINGHVVVVDNDSNDGSVEAIADWIAREAADKPVTLVRSATNTGFAGGHNIGMGAMEAEFYMLLNSDGMLRPGCLATLIAAARARPEMGFFAPRIEAQDGTPQVSAFRFASSASEFIRALNTGPVRRLLKHRDVSIGTDPDEAEIEWASFACILLRHEMVAEIGPMDEGYFLYFEDAEYCLRARRAGWRVAWVPEARMVHFHGRSGPLTTLDEMRKRLPGYYYASRTRFLFQAHGRAGLILANLMWLLGRVLTQVRRLFGKPVRPPAEAEARDIWINSRQPLGPRLAPHEIAAGPAR